MPLSHNDASENGRLINEYNIAFDGRDAEAFAECFVSDGRFVFGEQDQARGRDGLTAYVASTEVPGQLRHLTTSVMTQSDGDAATSQAYCTVFASSPGAGYQVIAQGVYRDKLTNGNDGWRCTERRLDQYPA